MSVPDLKYVVQQVRDSKPWPFRSKEQLCAYTQACITALHAVDKDFGNLRKIPAQNHCTDGEGRLHATDVALYKPTGQIIDFIGSAGFEPDETLPEPGNDVVWSVGHEGEYPEDKWFAPVGTPPVVDLEARVKSLEAEVAMNKTRMEDINTRFDNESKDNVKKPLPDYVGTVRVFGFSFNIVSKPR